MTDSRIADVVLVVTGRASLDEVAQRHGVSRADVELWKQAYIAGMEGAVAGRRSLRRSRWPVVLLGALVVAGLASRISFASTACGTTLPGTIAPFCADSPALASEANNNYVALISYIETKIGSIANPDLAIGGNANVSGQVTSSRINLASNAIPATASATIGNDSSTASLVIAGRGTFPNRKVSLQDDVTVGGDLSVTGDLAVTGRLTGGGVSGTIVGGGQLNCLLTVGQTSGPVIGCVGSFGGATCPATPGVCTTSTRITCPTGSTARDTERSCTAPSSVPGSGYACTTTSWCVRD